MIFDMKIIELHTPQHLPYNDNIIMTNAVPAKA